MNPEPAEPRPWCLWCLGPLPPSRGGKPRLYCSQQHRQLMAYYRRQQAALAEVET